MSERPRLHGDGVTDDTAAVQWYLDHGLEVPSGCFVVLSALRIPQTAGGWAVAAKPAEVPE